jgi:hypothetical protein
MSATGHWENVYNMNAPEKAADRNASIIEAGRGESTLVDDLVDQEYRRITLLDISAKAIEVTRALGPEGPRKCSGLDVARYDARSLHQEFGPHFRSGDSSTELHRIPFGTLQQSLCYCVVEK